MDGLTQERINNKPHFSRSTLIVFRILVSRGKFPLIIVSSIFLFYFIALQLLEDWKFIDTAWFLIATISTVGYGDVTPNNEISRFLTILLIIVSIIAIAILSTLLFETASLVSKPKFWNEHMLENAKFHIIVVGNTPISATIADLFIELGIQPVILGNSLNDKLMRNYLNVVGDIRSAETFVKAKFEDKCLGVIITVPDDTQKINAAITVRSLDKSMPVFILLEIRKRVELTRPLPATVFTDLNLTVIDPANLLANEISKYLHLGKYQINSDESINIKSGITNDVLFEFQGDTINDPMIAFDHLKNDSRDILLIGHSQHETSDFSLGFPFDPDNISHLILLGKKERINEFRSSFCDYTSHSVSEHALILGFGETSKVLLPVLAQTKTEITVLDIHQEKIFEAQKFAIDNVILTDFFELYGLETKEPFKYDLCIINLPKIQAIAALARIKILNSKTNTVVTVNDAVDAPYFYSHGTSLVLVRSQLIAEAVIAKFFGKTLFFGNGLIEYITEMPSISVNELELKLRGKILIHFISKTGTLKYRPFFDHHTIQEGDDILFFHESTTIKRARYGH